MLTKRNKFVNLRSINDEGGSMADIKETSQIPQEKSVKVKREGKKFRLFDIFSGKKVRKRKIKTRKKINYKKRFNFSVGLNFFFGAVFLIMIGVVVWIPFWLNNYTAKLQLNYVDARNDMITGLYATNTIISENVPVRKDRLENYVKIAKSYVLKTYPKTTLSEKELAELLVKNFELAEQYMISPWEFISYVCIESCFDKKAVSHVGAKGIAQIMPSSMRMAIGDSYYNNCEFDPLLSCEAWYRMMIPIFEDVDGNRLWAAACYYSGPIAIRYYKLGWTIDKYMAQFKDPTVNKRYPYVIQETLDKLINYSALHLTQP